MRALSSLIRLLASVGIPESWKKDVERIRGQKPEDSPRKLLEQKADELKGKFTDRVITKPSLFLRDINKIIKYLESVQDPKKHGLTQDLSEFSNEVMSQARKGEVKVPAAKQTAFIDTASGLNDDGSLLTMFSNLFSEQYAGEYKKKRAVSSLLRHFADSISRL